MLESVTSKLPVGTLSSYLEIGSYAGESLLYTAKYLQKDARVVLVDLGDNGAAREALMKVIGSLRDRFNITLISGDSTDPQVIDKVRDLCPSYCYDLTLIDGNHDFAYVVSDLKHYGPFSSYVAMHDIDPRAIQKNIKKHGYEKPSAAHVWQVLRLTRTVEEFINAENEESPKGLGVVPGLSIGG